MTREEAIKLMQQFQLADIIKAIQAAYEEGYQAGYEQAVADGDDTPF